MTSRFGKTYSRKGGNGSSKFDEVFSNKRTTLSTKWGETTFMAKLGQKRPSVKPDISEVPKKPKVEDEVTEDPFGFDSDEESLPVSSKNVSQAKSSSQLEPGEAAQSEDFTPLLEANSRINQPDSGENVASSKGMSFDNTVPLAKEKSTSKNVEDGECKSSSAKVVTAEKIQNLNEDNENSHFIYENAEDGNKTNAETTDTSGYNTEAKDLPDSWDSHIGKTVDSPSETSQTKGPLRTHLYEWEDETEDTRTGEYVLDFDNEHLSEMKSKDEECDKEDTENPKEAISEELVQTIPRPSNCRTYCRSNKAKPQGATNFDKLMDGTSQSLSKANNESNSDGLNPARKVSLSSGTSCRGTVGRTRDYTVLHPSCLSVCNVTIQDTMERIDEFTTTAPTDLGEAGRLRKKADIATTKTTTRFRPSNTKSKKDVKLEFFGFDDQDEGGGDEGASRSSGSSNYKIKYFGFDDLSESEDEDEEWQVAERKANKKRSRTAPSSSLQSTSDGNENCSQDSQLSTNADLLEFSEDASGVLEGNKKSTNKQGDKSKENTRKIFSGPKRSPTKAVYNARHWNQPESEALPAPPVLKTPSVPVRLSSKEAIHKDDGVFKAPAPPPKVIKTVTIPTQPYQEIVTALKCRKEDKELYTVVQHVKHFNDVVEFGENQEFTDDIEYLLSGLKSNQPLNTRCLSVISLATKCAMPSFRMHLRAHGMVAMVFKTLDDSQHHQNLSLCTAALMYILSRDRLNMDLDRASLDLMIRLLELEQDASSAKLLNEKDMNKIKEKIRRLCETVHNKHLDLENITTGHLAMETLLSLTSKRAGDWFKEELRLLGGLDHIVDKVKECVDHLSSDENEEKLVASLWGAERCLRVLESVTVHNPENQSYLIAYKDSQLIVSSAKALQHCEELIQRYNRAEDSICLPDNKPLPHQNVANHVGKAVEDCMRAIIGVLLNLTNDNEWGSTKTGEQDGLIGTAMNCVLQVPKFLPQEQRFDIRVLGLGLLINLVEYSARNRHCLVNMETSCSFDSFCTGEDDSLKITGQIDAVQALVQLFLECERAAQLAESQTDELIKEAPTAQHDKSGEWQETSGEIQWVSTEKPDSTEEKDKKEEDDEELDLNKALQHAGKHMEDCIVASYTALLLGCLCQESPINVTTVREYLPEGDFSIMTEMLKKFLSFMNLTCAVGTTGQKSISRVIEYLEHC
ncbi:wings apart-like protein homolog isoform X1 [Falco biarmicus]|uniref:wings apart-like protein homolog isoform X1 n=1 Tax=Falco peregrinus TaxID=8954 RepID=UPI0003870D7D|nr:wings apart-like protein homolog isoform X1 [Falco peregrinus]XP_005433527.1 wings apart-like protein homolog isoform X1 [Falco cherrug]XP_027641501.1 wings apart-like protein homolog isoform X1 [Falco peregrinus]XP_027641502.1 wings apart-like protein homolog isoform X1 [Falco peregrinus]XP_027672973.1 wings apart-like protein homolog isoform X1 [Falco cherrug]XP_027672974.1 wings apart-like protein homolog isoform X1 [Falco cherrug]XP_037256819.1 wings apart-like protein homolog isoform 